MASPKERETRSITAHNTHEQDAVSSRHQPGGTGMICRSKFLQHARKASVDPRGLGRWCSWQFFCNPNHVSRVVVAYRTCHSKTKGLRTIYQQQLRYIQANGINCSPVELFDRDLAKQIKEGRNPAGMDCTLLYQVINLVLYYRVRGVKVPLVYSILNSNT